MFNYLQPFPAKGTGYQRMIFILYQQTSEINFSSIKSVSEKLVEICRLLMFDQKNFTMNVYMF